MAALLLEQNDEWGRRRERYMTLESVAQLSDDPAVTLPAMAAYQPGLTGDRCGYAAQATPPRDTTHAPHGFVPRLLMLAAWPVQWRRDSPLSDSQASKKHREIQP